MISWATVPTTISERAVETLNQIAHSVATSASPTQSAARNQTFKSPFLWRSERRELRSETSKPFELAMYGLGADSLQLTCALGRALG